jgi:hypothetical protein
MVLVAREEGGGRIRCFEVSEGMSTCQSSILEIHLQNTEKVNTTLKCSCKSILKCEVEPLLKL